MRKGFLIQNALLGASALVVAAGFAMPNRDNTGPVLNAAATFVNGTAPSASPATTTVATTSDGEVTDVTTAALSAFSSIVRGLSRPEALETAFKSYFAFKSAHPNEVKKPYLYFVDFGLPATAKRGYVFDMEKLQIVDGPFTVAAGKGSQKDGGVPTKFSNAARSAAS
jgi:flagellar hook-basal body complex protein FliE